MSAALFQILKVKMKIVMQPFRVIENTSLKHIIIIIIRTGYFK